MKSLMSLEHGIYHTISDRNKQQNGEVVITASMRDPLSIGETISIENYLLKTQEVIEQRESKCGDNLTYQKIMCVVLDTSKEQLSLS